MPRKINLFLLLTSLLVLGFSLHVYPQATDTVRTPDIDSAGAARADSVAKAAKVLSQQETMRNRMILDSIRRNRDSTAVSYFTSNFEKIGSLALHPVDTAITGFENYDVLYKNNRFYASLGNIGQNARSFSPFPFLRESGFDYGIHSFDPYVYSNDSVRYYRVTKTYTELFYAQGAKREMNFHAIFSRNIYRSLNLGFDFRVASSPGAYLRQKTNHINFVLTTQYFSKSKRYGLIANFAINRLRNYENGGIKYDSLFESNLESNRQIIPVNLESALNNIRETGLFMKHYFNLSRHPRSEKDTSTVTGVDLGRISYSFQYNRQMQNFIDNNPDSGFFPTPLIDSVQTFDSVRVIKLVNEVIWSNPTFNPDNKPRVLQLEAGLRQQYSEVWLHGQKNIFNQFIPHAGIDFNPFGSLRLQARGDYVLGAYNENDLSLRVILSTILGRRDKNGGIITLTGNYIFQKPGWFYEHYQGNSFRWDTAWLKQGLISGGFNYSWKFLESGINLSRISNFVYLDTTGTPRQNTKEFGYMQVYLNTDLDLWKFKIRAQLNYQTVQGTTVLRLPVFAGNVAIYFTQVLFKRAATLQPGLNFFYNSSYYADNYNPATRSFYLQDRREIGNYVYMDVFVNLKIQRARFFFIYSHFNAGFMSRDYYTTPTYPMQDAAFKFGIAWRFHD